MNMNEEMFECFSLNSLNQKEYLDRAKVIGIGVFLRSDLSILNEREIVSVIVNNESFSKKSRELIKAWATIFKSKKLFEMAEDSNLTDVEFGTKLKEFSCSELFMKNIHYIDWKYAAIDMNNEYISSVEGFYEEIVLILARDNTLVVELIEEFNLRGVDWNYRDVTGENLLICLCDKDNLNMDLLTCLLDKGIDINIQNFYKETAFMSVCRNEFITLNMVELFFDNKVDINIQADWGHTAFMVLCENKFITLDVIKLFFDKGVDIDFEDYYGETAFMKLCANMSITFDMVKLFLEKGADLNIRNRDGLNSLDFYIRSGGQNEEILKLLGQG